MSYLENNDEINLLVSYFFGSMYIDTQYKIFKIAYDTSMVTFPMLCLLCCADVLYGLVVMYKKSEIKSAIP